MRFGRIRAGWQEPPSFKRLAFEGMAYGGALGSLAGSATLIFQGNPYGLLLGLAFGGAYGLVFALGGWSIGWLSYRAGITPTKGRSLAFGVIVTALLIILVLWAAGGTVDPVVVLVPCVVAVLVGILRGRAYDRLDLTIQRPRQDSNLGHPV